MQEQNQLKRLDWVLHFMAIHAVQGIGQESAWDRIKELHPTIHIEGNESFRHQIFEKLIDDKLIRKDSDNNYWITLDGAIFSDYGKGGYVSEKISSDAEKQRVRLLEGQMALYAKRLNLTTLYLVLATLFLSLIEIWHIYLECY